MKRWDGAEYTESKKVDAFLEEIKSICEKHGFSISHEDWQGAFIIEKYDENNIDWLLAADNETGT